MVAIGKTPSNLMKIYNFWLTAFGESGADFEATSLLRELAGEAGSGEASAAKEQKTVDANRMSGVLQS
jgi:hypothetical protein